MKKISLLVLSILLFFFSYGRAEASDLTVTCQGDGPCSINPASAALFSDDSFLPGQSRTRTIFAINNDNDEDCSLYLDTLNEKDADQLSGRIFTAITGANEIFGSLDTSGKATSVKTLRTLFDSGSIFLSDIPKSSEKEIHWVVTFNPETNDTFQGKKVSFDFDLQFSCGSPPEPTATQTPAPADTTQSPTSTPTPASIAALGGFAPLTGLTAFLPLAPLEELENLGATPTPAGAILGTGFTSPESPTKAGANSNISGLTCRSLPLWPGIILAQIGVSLLLLSRSYKRRLGTLCAGLIASYLLAIAAVIINLSCTHFIFPLWWGSAVLLASLTSLLRLHSICFRHVLHGCSQLEDVSVRIGEC